MDVHAGSWLNSIRRAWQVRALERAVAAGRKANDARGHANRVRRLGDAYRHASRLQEAETCYVEAIALYRRDPSSNRLDLANAIRGLAILKEREGDNEEALRLWEEAHDLYGSVNVLAGVAEAAAHLAVLCRDHGDSRKGQEWIEKAVTTAMSSGDGETQQYVRETKARLEGLSGSS